ncbi:TPA: hypothetical protein F6U33_22515 [Citrobacter freundii]|uniref:hypothetical protein n=1 Tax=Citrobacter TaxID=544 RepID=UPI000846A75C|nr:MULTISPECIES: hypothetical protein [Citrobacter]MBA7999428.1 hypothetical protein [Citrobacter freundii]HAT2815113.1 hypothetical protein [Citrobacter freundii]HAU4305990.1 hypothetical protein [Citrobacter freundii]HAU5694728.1 hypothetical protein [Citrobacter freundii]HBB6887137.1 hypothetical protein [Citrobacter freundii]
MVNNEPEKLIDDENALEPESLACGIVNLNSKFTLDAEDKRHYQCADIVQSIIKFESSIQWSVDSILNGVNKAESNGYSSTELSELKELTVNYINELKEIQERATRQCLELAHMTLLAHGIKLDTESHFDVDGYQFKATPVTDEVNYIVSDLFSYSDIANINMSLNNVTVTGEKKIRKSQLPTRLIMNLWVNNEERCDG